MKIKKEITMMQKEYDILLKELEVIFEDSPIYNDCSFGDFVNSIVKERYTDYGYDLTIEQIRAGRPPPPFIFGYHFTTLKHYYCEA